jgi:hypothetical protein
MNWGEMTVAQALSKSTSVQSIKTKKTDRLTVPQPVRIAVFMDDPPQLEMILYPPQYRNDFAKSNTAFDQTGPNVRLFLKNLILIDSHIGLR